MVFTSGGGSLKLLLHGVLLIELLGGLGFQVLELSEPALDALLPEVGGNCHRGHSDHGDQCNVQKFHSLDEYGYLLKLLSPGLRKL